MAPADTFTPLAYPHKNDSYVHRIPTPPRIVVPPPALDSNATPSFQLGASLTLPGPGTAYENLVIQNPLIEWSYERRREAQTILPYLYLGPMTAAKDEQWMKEVGITMVLGVRQKHEFSYRLMDGALKRVQGWGIEARTVDLANHMDLIHAFPDTTGLINNHLAAVHARTGELGKVLLFCESGNERSAGVAAAYLMETHQDVDYIKAMQLVQAQRFCVNFDDAMKRLLQGYWDIQCARRAVAGNGSLGVGMTDRRGSTKRSLERDEDEEMGGQHDDDEERFGGRSFVPFSDQAL